MKTLLFFIWLYICLINNIVNTVLEFNKNNSSSGIIFLTLSILLLITIINVHITEHEANKEKIKSKNFVVDHEVKYWLNEFTVFLK